MIDNLPKECCGCSACESACSHKAIQMVSDPLGFLLPKVTASRCVDCGLCENVCPILHPDDVNLSSEFPVPYAARHKDIKEVETSRSGAVFMALASYIIDEGGVVYGAAFSNVYVVKHQKAQQKAELIKFKGSKYTQSDMGGVIVDIRKELLSGHTVLFSGTPCQTAAVRNSISRQLSENLYLVDIICHGTASPKFWTMYIKDLENREHRKIVKVEFRDKSIFGWDGLHRESFIFDNGRKYTYPRTFYQPFLIRELCSRCPFASLRRPSDLTLGDFWNYKTACATMNRDGKGISLLLVNSRKGSVLFDNIKNELEFRQLHIEQCLQPNLEHPTPRDILADDFAKDFDTKGYKFVLNKYYPLTLTEQIKYWIKRAMGKH